MPPTWEGGHSTLPDDQRLPFLALISSGDELVTVDVEGWELEVLAGLDFERYRPKVLIIENLFCDEDYRRFMAERGYALWRIAFPNEVYVRTELLSRRERFVASALAAGPTAAHRCRAAATQLYREVCRRLAR